MTPKRIDFEFPGLTKQNVHIDVKEGVLSVSGERDDKAARTPWPAVLEPIWDIKVCS